MAIRHESKAFDRRRPYLHVDDGIQDTAGPERAQDTLLDEWACAPPRDEVFVQSTECQFNAGHSIKENVNRAESIGRMSDVRR